jgi:hypothetical protein
MDDRRVCQINPDTGQNAAPAPFSSFADRRNIVVLGDPGAGKSHLFRQATDLTGGVLSTARNFLNSVDGGIPEGATLFIDALDEKRGGRGDDDTIDALVQRIQRVRPQYLRIACRAADWLGESDLAAFKPYFDANGGVTVVGLEPLHPSEQAEILQDLTVADADAFLTQARARGLDGMLVNPQTLIMLADVVRNGDWPSTRTELFERASAVLLAETNREHARRGAGAYTADELIDAAGALCAVRLISDCPGLSLSAADRGDAPSYRNVAFGDAEKALAALTRRAFVRSGQADVVEYSHRTVAEYLAARWLVDRIRQGLPLGRVRALLGVDGTPTSALRGLHAWLATLAIEHTAQLIDADPLGALLYGDAAAMATGARLHLLDALGELSKRDAGFYGHQADTPALSALTGSDMVESFRRVLDDRAAPFRLRQLVLDAMPDGTSVPGLHDCLRDLLRCEEEPYLLRQRSLELLAGTETGRAAILDTYATFGAGEDGLRLRADAFQCMYGRGLGKQHFRAFLDDIGSSSHRLATGPYYGLEHAFPVDDIADILEMFLSWSIPEENDDGIDETRKKDAVHYLFQHLIVRLLAESDHIDAGNLLELLLKRLDLSGGYEMLDDLSMAIKSREGLPERVVAAWIAVAATGDAWIHEMFGLRLAMLGTVDDHVLMRGLGAALGQYESRKDAVIYESLLRIVFGQNPDFHTFFEGLHAYAEGKPALMAVRERYCASPVEYRWIWAKEEDATRAAKRSEDRAKRFRERCRDFDENEASIAAGEHLRWLGRIGDVYFSHRSHGSNALAVEQRLPDWLGPERAATAREGLKRLVANRTLTPLAEIIAIHNERKFWPYWDAVVAGLDILFGEGADLEDFSDDYIAAAIGITCYRSFLALSHGWLDETVRRRPRLALDAYATILAAGLSADEEHPSGLYKLQSDALAGAYRLAKVRELLHAFPDMRANSLQELLAIALADGEDDTFEVLIDHAIDVCSGRSDREETLLHWLAFGLTRDMPRYADRVQVFEGETARRMAWVLLEFRQRRRRRPGSVVEPHAVGHLEFTAKYVAHQFPNTHMPTGSSVGRRNDWHASNEVNSLLSALSTDTSDEAHAALQRLCDAPEMATYADYAKHLLAQQRTRMIDARYRSPTWRDAVSTLSNKTPTSMPDLLAYAMDQLADAGRTIANGNTDMYKRFWNEQAHTKIVDPKPEESARDALIDILRSLMFPLGMRVEPEGHMPRDKRADIVMSLPGMTLSVELKRDYHTELWTAAENQLERWYTRHPESLGHGIYGVFWYGEQRPENMRKPPDGAARPAGAAALQAMLEARIPPDKREKIRVVVLDVSGMTDG